MIVLDTNVISAVIGGKLEDTVLRWLDSLRGDNYLTSITAAELRYGVARRPSGSRRDRLNAEVEGLLLEDFDDAVLPFDEAASRPYAEIMAHRRAIGRPVSIPDAQIAAICLSRGAELATRNIRDFTDLAVALVNPWDLQV